MKTHKLKLPFRYLFTAVTLLGISTTVLAQDPLDSYVAEGLQSNLVLQQKELSLEQARESFQIAKSYFFPSVSLLSDYTSGEGGRSISIPVGDMLNPVYASLNQLTQSDAFPQIENVDQNFFPKNFYDVRARTSMPLFNSDLYYNKTVKDNQMRMEQYGLDAYKRQLVYEIKSAYYRYLAATSAVKIYESASTLVDRNLEVNQSLLKNGKSLPANVIRSRSEVERVKAALNSAKNDSDNAKKYFNFLLNRDLDTDIEAGSPIEEPLSADTLSGLSTSISNREEIQMLRTANDINLATLRNNQLARLPKVSAFLDLGSQAEDWAFDSNSLYYLVGVQLSMPLFQGFRNSTMIRKSRHEIEKSELDLRNTKNQLQMAAEVARNNVETAIRNLYAARDQLESAQSYFNLIEKGYQEGVNSQIEFLDARNQLTTSQLQKTLRQFEALTALAQWERETASYNFK